MDILFFMGLVTPLIQFCRVISSGMVESSSSQSSKTFPWSFLVVYERPLYFPFNVTLIIQYAIYIIFLKTLCLHHHGPRYFNYSYFCMMCGFEKLGLVDHQN